MDRSEMSETSSSPEDILRSLASEWKQEIHSRRFAEMLDQKDPLSSLRQNFHIPKIPGTEEEVIYFCGHSLGPQPKTVKEKVNKVLDHWKESGLACQFSGDVPVSLCDLKPKSSMARLVGAKDEEVAIMSGLTVDLHILLASFYRPSRQRCKILIEAKTFVSDLFVVKSQLEFHGHNPEKDLIIVEPRQGEEVIRESDLKDTIKAHGPTLALVLLPGVQYYTGQKFDIQAITRVIHEQGCVAGWDLAHAAGNVELKLHHWGVDFAAWCTYKYLSSGPGGIAAIFVHERHHSNPELPRLKGWWGLDPDHKFYMTGEFVSCKGAGAFKLSNPSPLLTAMLQASLEVYEQAGMTRVVQKQFLLTGYLELLLRQRLGHRVRVITPSDPRYRGSQLSLRFPGHPSVDLIFRCLEEANFMSDFRRPSVIRIAPHPLYNSFSDVYKGVSILDDVLDRTDIHTSP